MKTFSLDLRTRILAACDKHDSTRQQVADRFGVSLGFVKKLLGQRKRVGVVGDLYFRAGRKQAVSEEKRARMREYVRLHPGATLAEIASACRLSCTIATVDNTLRRMGLTYKKRRCAPPSRTAGTSPRSGKPGGSGPGTGIRRGSSSSTRPASRRR
jgi:transposase